LANSVEQSFGGDDGGRGILGNLAGKREDRLFQVVCRHNPIDQADPQRLDRVEPTSGDKNLLGHGHTNQTYQPAQFVDAKHDPKLGRRDTKLGAVIGNSQVTGDRQFATTSDAIAVDHGNDRLLDGCERSEGILDDGVMGSRALRGLTVAREFVQISAGRKGPFTCSAHNQYATDRVLAERTHAFGELSPHCERQRIVALRSVECDQPDLSVVQRLSENLLIHLHLPYCARIVADANRSALRTSGCVLFSMTAASRPVAGSGVKSYVNDMFGGSSVQHLIEDEARTLEARGVDRQHEHVE